MDFIFSLKRNVFKLHNKSKPPHVSYSGGIAINIEKEEILEMQEVHSLLERQLDSAAELPRYHADS